VVIRIESRTRSLGFGLIPAEKRKEKMHTSRYQREKSSSQVLVDKEDSREVLHITQASGSDEMANTQDHPHEEADGPNDQISHPQERVPPPDKTHRRKHYRLGPPKWTHWVVCWLVGGWVVNIIIIITQEKRIQIIIIMLQ
jgi:hypothetical protein